MSILSCMPGKVIWPLFFSLVLSLTLSTWAHYTQLHPIHRVANSNKLAINFIINLSLMLITPKKGFQLFAFEFQIFQGDHHTAQVNKGRRGFLFRPELDQTHTVCPEIAERLSSPAAIKITQAYSVGIGAKLSRFAAIWLPSASLQGPLLRKDRLFTNSLQLHCPAFARWRTAGRPPRTCQMASSARTWTWGVCLASTWKQQSSQVYVFHYYLSV